MKTNFANNQVGSCSYVALGSLLTYYDTFLHDDIVPGDYEVMSASTTIAGAISDSPGSQFYTIPTDNYSIGVTNSSNMVLQSRLMSDYKQYYGSFSFSVNFDKFYGILNQFFLGRNIDYSLTYHQRNNNESIDAVNSRLKEIALSKINSGVPVLLAISGYNNPGDDEYQNYHTVLGYDTDSNNDIMAHFGWNSSTTYSSLSSQGYGKILQVAYLDFNMSHAHTSNYKVGNTYYCFDGADPYAHVHSYSYRMKNSNQHYVSCDCGYSSVALHSFRSLGGSLGSECTYCGFPKLRGIYYVEKEYPLEEEVNNHD